LALCVLPSRARGEGRSFSTQRSTWVVT
jgi:hypothetical protein